MVVSVVVPWTICFIMENATNSTSLTTDINSEESSSPRQFLLAQSFKNLAQAYLGFGSDCYEFYHFSLYVFLPLAGLALVLGKRDIFSKLLVQLDRKCVAVFCPSLSSRERVIKWASARLPITWSSQTRTLSGGIADMWTDGSLLCTILNSAIPGACPNPHRHWKQPPDHAQAIAYKYLNIPPMFTKEDFTGTFSLDQERNFLHYLGKLSTAIDNFVAAKDDKNQPVTLKYLARGMGLFSGEQHKTTSFYIYSNQEPKFMRNDNILILIRGPYSTFGKSEIIFDKNPKITVQNLTKPEFDSASKPKLKPSLLRQLSRDLTSFIKPEKKAESSDIEISVEHEDGRVKVTYRPNNFGMYEINLVTNGEKLMGCPFYVHIIKSNANSNLAPNIEALPKKPDPDYRAMLMENRRMKIVSKTSHYVNEEINFNTHNIYYNQKYHETSSSSATSTSKDSKDSKDEKSEEIVKSVLDSSQDGEKTEENDKISNISDIVDKIRFDRKVKDKLKKQAAIDEVIQEEGDDESSNAESGSDFGLENEKDKEDLRKNEEDSEKIEEKSKEIEEIPKKNEEDQKMFEEDIKYLKHKEGSGKIKEDPEKIKENPKKIEEDLKKIERNPKKNEDQKLVEEDSNYLSNLTESSKSSKISKLPEMTDILETDSSFDLPKIKISNLDFPAIKIEDKNLKKLVDDPKCLSNLDESSQSSKSSKVSEISDLPSLKIEDPESSFEDIKETPKPFNSKKSFEDLNKINEDPKYLSNLSESSKSVKEPKVSEIQDLPLLKIKDPESSFKDIKSIPESLVKNSRKIFENPQKIEEDSKYLSNLVKSSKSPNISENPDIPDIPKIDSNVDFPTIKISNPDFPLDLPLIKLENPESSLKDFESIQEFSKLDSLESDSLDTHAQKSDTSTSPICASHIAPEVESVAVPRMQLSPKEKRKLFADSSNFPKSSCSNSPLSAKENVGVVAGNLGDLSVLNVLGSLKKIEKELQNSSQETEDNSSFESIYLEDLDEEIEFSGIKITGKEIDDLKDKKNIRDMKDMKDSKNVKDMNDIRDMKYIKDMEDIKDIRDTKDMKDIRDIKDVTDIKNIRDIKYEKDMKDIKDLKDMEDKKYIEDIRDMKDLENMHNIRDIKDIKDIQNIRDIKYVKDIKDMKDIRDMKDKKEDILSKVKIFEDLTKDEFISKNQSKEFLLQSKEDKKIKLDNEKSILKSKFIENKTMNDGEFKEIKPRRFELNTDLENTRSLPNITCRSMSTNYLYDFEDNFQNVFKEKKSFWETLTSSSSANSSSLNSLQDVSGKQKMFPKARSHTLSSINLKSGVGDKEIQRESLRKSADDILSISGNGNRISFKKSEKCQSVDGSLDLSGVLSIEERKKLLLKQNYDKEIEAKRKFTSFYRGAKDIKGIKVNNIELANNRNNLQDRLSSDSNLAANKIYIHNDLKRWSSGSKNHLKSHFQKAVNYFKKLENGNKDNEKVKLERSRSLDGASLKNTNKLGGSNKKTPTGGSLNLPKVSQRFSINNLYNDVFGNANSNNGSKKGSFKGTPNKSFVLEALSTLGIGKSASVASDSEDDIRYSLFKGGKRKQRPKLSSIFDL